MWPRALEISEGDKVCTGSASGSPTARRCASRTPTWLTASFPSSWTPPFRESLYAEFKRRDLLPTWGEDSVDADLAKPDEAELLGIEPGSPVLRIARRAFAGNIAVEVSRSTYRADRYTLWVPVCRPNTPVRATAERRPAHVVGPGPPPGRRGRSAHGRAQGAAARRGWSFLPAEVRGDACGRAGATPCWSCSAPRPSRAAGSSSTGRASVVVADDWDEGMGASLRAGLAAADPTDAQSVLVSLVDLPDVGADVVRRLLAGGGAGEGRARPGAYEGTPGHPVLIGRDHWAGVGDTARGDRVPATTSTRTRRCWSSAGISPAGTGRGHARSPCDPAVADAGNAGCMSAPGDDLRGRPGRPTRRHRLPVRRRARHDRLPGHRAWSVRCCWRGSPAPARPRSPRRSRRRSTCR